ncbi:hypothetical protein PVAND_016548 [Polypedilum vanderplanki]|uniref:Uncharacterized protein n=1 Tax=Polypedilum vanderplanki TaxID=319348 RepID=A0A9J6B942_POLVA|nr:hypothetical protein PVAND_017675 [Polypedilum vanderplanki]KAG5668612.1 hypothetical protein PVAND_016548 [Polypedilum vanderplanki]
MRLAIFTFITFAIFAIISAQKTVQSACEVCGRGFTNVDCFCPPGAPHKTVNEKDNKIEICCSRGPNFKAVNKIDKNKVKDDEVEEKGKRPEIPKVVPAKNLKT